MVSKKNIEKRYDNTVQYLDLCAYKPTIKNKIAMVIRKRKVIDFL